MAEVKKKKWRWYAKITSREDALDAVKGSSTAFFVVGAIQVAVSFFLGFSILFRCRDLPHWRIPPASLPQPRGGGRNTGTRGVLALRNSGEQTGRKSGRGLKHFLVVDRPLGRDPGSRGDIQIEESVCFGTATR